MKSDVQPFVPNDNSGYLLINKPKTWTSHDVVAKIRNILKIKKVGHTGTLDPFATGLLILLIGDATKLSETLTNLDKEYVVTSKFGISTDTADITGKIIKEEIPKNIEKSDFEKKIPDILQINKQIPSRFSAIKINGKKAYNMARSGKDFELPERSIEIKEFELIDYDFPCFTWRAVVSKGTYVRTLTEQIAELFDSIATTIELERTKIGKFCLKDSIGINEVSFGMKIGAVAQISDGQIVAPISDRHSVGDTYCPPHVSGTNFSPHIHGGGRGGNRTDTPIRPVLTIGTFDGVHLGHQYLLKKTVKKAKELGTESIVITYSKHPNEVLNSVANIYCPPHVSGGGRGGNRDESPKYLLTEYKKRDELIKKTGIDKIHYIDFDIAMSQMTAEDFIKNVLIKNFNPSHLVIGYDTHLGVNQSGTREYIKEKAREYDCETIEVESYKKNNLIVSSTLIRNLLKEGCVDSAMTLLGDYYSVIGKVVSNKKIGRKIGFPTMNLKPLEESKLIPKSGIYFTCTKLDDHYYLGATNIGTSPTIKTENQIEIETFLIDFSGDAYEKEIELFFIEKIRDEKCFDSIEDLTEQIKKDIEVVKNLYNTSPPTFMPVLSLLRNDTSPPTFMGGIRQHKCTHTR